MPSEAPHRRRDGPFQNCHLRLDRALRQRVDAYCEREQVRFASGTRALLNLALDHDQSCTLDRAWTDSVPAAELFQLRREQALMLGAQFDLLKKTAAAVFGTGRLLAHWSAKAPGGVRASEDEILAEIRVEGWNEVEQALAERPYAEPPGDPDKTKG